MLGKPRVNSNEKTPVVVCGAGAAGIAAAIAAARHGASVYLVEPRRHLGGTVTHTLIHTLGGLYDAAGELINEGLAGELARRLHQADARVRQREIGRTRVLNVCPQVYLRIVEAWIADEPRIALRLGMGLSRVMCRDGRVVELEATGPVGSSCLRPKALIDATGTAEAVRMIDRTLVEDDSRAAAGGWIFTMRGVKSGALEFPKGLGVLRSLYRAVAEGTLPAECSNAWVDTGLAEGEAYVKLSVPLPDDWRERESRGEITRRACRTQATIVDFLQKRPDFSQAFVHHTGRLGVRDGGRIIGEYRLTVQDVRQGQTFADAACRCNWPIEYWDPVEGVSLEDLSEGTCYEIPRRALKVAHLKNVWAAGKCLSADREAQASARVVGTCWAMGEAAGREAALCG